MKKIFNKIFAAVLVAGLSVAFAACSSDNGSGIKSYPVSVNLNLGDGLALDNISNLQLVVKSDKGVNDTVNLSSAQTPLVLKQGVYDFSVIGKVKDEATAFITGLAKANVYAQTSVTLDVSKVYQSTLIFKTIYNAGGKQYYVKDSFFEIVNNSDEVQYLDNLILASALAGQKTQNAWQANGITDLNPMANGAVLAFPGNGHDYPLLPGQSILIANDAANHADADHANAPNCPDLSNADWEVYLDYHSKEGDYPAKNLKVIFTNNKYMPMWGFGVQSIALALVKLPEGVTPEDFASDASNFQTTPGSTSTQEYMMIPSKYVLDAVDVWNANSTEHYGFFLAKDDKQGVLCSDAYAAKCERRKVSKTVNGRKYYQDTNNSADDFLTSQPLKEE